MPKRAWDDDDSDDGSRPKRQFPAIEAPNFTDEMTVEFFGNLDMKGELARFADAVGAITVYGYVLVHIQATSRSRGGAGGEPGPTKDWSPAELTRVATEVISRSKRKSWSTFFRVFDAPATTWFVVGLMALGLQDDLRYGMSWLSVMPMDAQIALYGAVTAMLASKPTQLVDLIATQTKYIGTALVRVTGSIDIKTAWINGALQSAANLLFKTHSRYIDSNEVKTPSADERGYACKGNDTYFGSQKCYSPDADDLAELKYSASSKDVSEYCGRSDVRPTDPVCTTLALSAVDHETTSSRPTQTTNLNWATVAPGMLALAGIVVTATNLRAYNTRKFPELIAFRTNPDVLTRDETRVIDAIMSLVYADSMHVGVDAIASEVFALLKHVNCTFRRARQECHSDRDTLHDLVSFVRGYLTRPSALSYKAAAFRDACSGLTPAARGDSAETCVHRWKTFIERLANEHTPNSAVCVGMPGGGSLRRMMCDTGSARYLARILSAVAIAMVVYSMTDVLKATTHSATRNNTFVKWLINGPNWGKHCETHGRNGDPWSIYPRTIVQRIVLSLHYVFSMEHINKYILDWLDPSVSKTLDRMQVHMVKYMKTPEFLHQREVVYDQMQKALTMSAVATTIATLSLSSVRRFFARLPMVVTHVADTILPTWTDKFVERWCSGENHASVMRESVASLTREIATDPRLPELLGEAATDAIQPGSSPIMAAREQVVKDVHAKFAAKIPLRVVRELAADMDFSDMHGNGRAKAMLARRCRAYARNIDKSGDVPRPSKSPRM